MGFESGSEPGVEMAVYEQFHWFVFGISAIANPHKVESLILTSSQLVSLQGPYFYLPTTSDLFIMVDPSHWDRG
jgi:hypothetical protein